VSTAGGETPDPIDLDAMLADARSELDRLGPEQALAAQEAGALIVDIRPESLRREEGEVVGSVVIDRNVLEWRLAPSSPHRASDLEVIGRPVVVMCSEGYASSFAAASLRRLGIAGATDLDGGYRGWKAAGLPWGPTGTGDDRTAPPTSD
jgi:rhodanese-related sulfurtransferase